MEDKQKLILWIHGFAGKPDNDSVQEMRRHYPAYDFYYGPKLVVNPVVDPVRDLRQFLGEYTYKPGRPDGQTTFLFTEEMLQEYATLEVQPLSRTLCHHTAHDHVLGEAIKADYARMSSQRQEIADNILPNHFLTFRYVKTVFGQTLEDILGAV